MTDKTVTILLDIWAGPIWGCTFDEKLNKYTYKINTFCQDKTLMRLHQEIQDLFSSYYHFDYNGQPVYFDEKQEIKDKDKMLCLLTKLRKRIDALNDGSLIIDDRETDRVKHL